MILAAGKITEIKQFTPPYFIIQHRKLDAVRQPDTELRPGRRAGRGNENMMNKFIDQSQLAGAAAVARSDLLGGFNFIIHMQSCTPEWSCFRRAPLARNRTPWAQAEKPVRNGNYAERKQWLHQVAARHRQAIGAAYAFRRWFPTSKPCANPSKPL